MVDRDPTGDVLEILQGEVDAEGYSGFECYEDGSDLPACRCLSGELLKGCCASRNPATARCLPFVMARR